MSALNLGELFVTLNARTGAMGKELAGAAKQVEQFGRHVERVSAKAQSLGNALTIGLGVAVALAAQHNRAVADQLEKQKLVFGTFANEIAKALLPALKMLTSFLLQVLGAWQGLAPGTRSAVAKFLEFAAIAGVVIGVTGKVLGIITALAPAIVAVATTLISAVTAFAAFVTAELSIAGIGAAISAGFSAVVTAAGSLLAFLAPIALAVGAVVIVLGGLFVMAGVIREAWDENLGGIQDKFRAVGKWISDKWTALLKLFRSGSSQIGEWLGKSLDFLREKFHEFVELFVRGLGVINELSGNRLTGLTDFLSDLARYGEHLTTRNGLAELADDAVVAWDFAAKGIKKNITSIKDLIDKLTPGGGKKGHVFDPTSPVTSLGQSRGVTAAQLYGSPFTPTPPPSLSANAFAIAMQAAMAQRAAPANRITSTSVARSDLNAVALNVFKSAGETMKDSIRNAAPKLTSALDAAFEGLKTGGMGGAATNTFATLLSKSKGFGDTMAVVESVVQSLADVLGSFLVPLQPLISTVMGVVEALSIVLRPVFELIATAVRPLIPILVEVGEVLKAIAPVLGLLLAGIELVQLPILSLAVTVLPAFFFAVKVLGEAVIGIAYAIASAWNGIVNAVQSVFQALGQISVFGIKPLQFLEGWAYNLGSAIVATGSMADAMDNLWKMTTDEAEAKANNTAATILNSDAKQAEAKTVRDVMEELSNVPQGFRVAAARYHATDAFSMSGLLGSSAAVGAAMSGVTVNVEGSVFGVDEMTQLVMDAIRKKNYRDTGAA